MTYTLWHCGVLIGETDFEGQGQPQHPRHLAGIFRPTSYGRDVFPKLTGFMSAASELKDAMKARGLSEESMETEDVVDFFETTAAGRKMVDIGRELSQVELRDPSGARLEFTSIAFIDLTELTALARKLELDSTVSTLDSLPPEAPQLVVSATLRETGRLGTDRLHRIPN